MTSHDQTGARNGAGPALAFIARRRDAGVDLYQLRFPGQAGVAGQPQNRAIVSDVPRPGRDLPFETWTDRLAVRLREMIPDVRATRRPKTATLVYRDRSATIVDRHPTWFVNFSAPVAGLAIDRFDDFTARTVAKSLAGYFDDRWSKGDS